MKSFFSWLLESMARTYTALGILAITVTLASAAATQTTSYDVTNNPQMYLDVSITSTQTTGIKISALSRNGTTVIFPNMTGGILRVRSGTRVEDLSFTGATVNSSTKVVTLAGVTRNICWNIANRIVTCGDGLSFSKGSIVELNVDARLLNFKLNKDRINLLTGSGQISGTGTGQSILDLPCVTTTQRDNMTNVSDGNIICNSTLGTFQYRAAGAWISFGSGSTINASESAAGKVQLATLPNMTGSAILGTTGAPLVLQSRYATQTGSLAINKGFIPLLGRRGVLTGSLLGINFGSYFQSGSVSLNSNTISGSYALTASQKFVPLSPIGSMMMWPTDTAPAGWVFADGKCHTRTGTGAALFAVLGTTFSSGCSGTTFGVPDMRGRFALGQDDMGGASANRVTDTRADSLGASSGSGSETTTLVTENLPSSDLSSNIYFDLGGASTQRYVATNGSVTVNANYLKLSGNSQPFQRMNPYLTLNYIIRAQ